MRLLILASAFVALAFPAAATSSASPVAPAAGAVTDGHPLFTWSLPAGEEAEAIAIANNPATTPDGDFFQENIRDFGSLQSTATIWQPSSPLHAGSYWWSVETITSDPFTVLHMPPQPFTVATVMSISRIQITRDTRLHRALMFVTYASNAEATSVTFTVKKGRHLYGSYTDPDNRIGIVGAQWKRRPGIKQGAKMSFSVTLKANGTTRTATRAFLAP